MPALMGYDFYFLPCFPLKQSLSLSLYLERRLALSPLDACARGLLLFATILSIATY